MAYLLLLLQISLASCTSFAQPQSSVSQNSAAQAYTEEKTFFSSSTNSKVQIALTLPPNYTSEKKYPLAVFLHGRGGDHFQFKQLGGEESLTQVVEETKVPFLVIAVKEPKHSYWKNGKVHGTATMVANDLLEYLQSIGLGVFSRYRGVFGISMGGHGALYLSQIYNSPFGSFYSLSPVFRTFETLLPEDRMIYESESDFEREDPVHIYRNQKQLPVKGRIEMGRDDTFLTSQPETRLFLQELKSNESKVNVDLSRSGGHDSQYWRPALKRALLFFAQNFFEANPKLRDSSSK